MPIKNATIIEKAYLEGSSDYAQRLPSPTVEGYAAHVRALFDPLNNDLYNEFAGMLNGLIGTVVESRLFQNPYRVLKKPAARFGNSERAVAVNYMQAHSYKVDDETLLKLEKPEFVEWFYSVTEPRRYEFSWSRYEMMRVFSEPDGYGFDRLLDATITQMLSSANYDEMNLMLHTFAEADQRMGGLYRENLSAAPTNKATAQELLQKVRAIAGNMQFPTRLYNHIPVPVHESAETLVFWCTPSVLSVIDVYALAELFHTDRAEVRYRILLVPEGGFGIPNVYAALTSEDFIYCRDVYVGMQPPFYNPATMTDKYYYQVAQMIGCNPAANAVLFTTDAQTTVPTITVAPSGLTFSPDTYTAAPGETVKLFLDIAGTVTGDTEGKIAVKPDAAFFGIVATRDGSAIEINSRTYVDSNNILHVQKSGLEADDVLTITATSVYINPSGSTATYTDTATVTITAPAYEACPVETDPYITYTDETEPASASE